MSCELQFVSWELLFACRFYLRHTDFNTRPAKCMFYLKMKGLQFWSKICSKNLVYVDYGLMSDECNQNIPEAFPF